MARVALPARLNTAQPPLGIVCTDTMEQLAERVNGAKRRAMSAAEKIA